MPIGWQLPAPYHCDVGTVELNRAPRLTMYLPAQLLAERLSEALLWNAVCNPFSWKRQHAAGDLMQCR